MEVQYATMWRNDIILCCWVSFDCGLLSWMSCDDAMRSSLIILLLVGIGPLFSINYGCVLMAIYAYISLSLRSMPSLQPMFLTAQTLVWHKSLTTTQYWLWFPECENPKRNLSTSLSWLTNNRTFVPLTCLLMTATDKFTSITCFSSTNHLNENLSSEPTFFSTQHNESPPYRNFQAPHWLSFPKKSETSSLQTSPVLFPKPPTSQSSPEAVHSSTSWAQFQTIRFDSLPPPYSQQSARNLSSAPTWSQQWIY